MKTHKSTSGRLARTEFEMRNNKRIAILAIFLYGMLGCQPSNCKKQKEAINATSFQGTIKKKFLYWNHNQPTLIINTQSGEYILRIQPGQIPTLYDDANIGDTIIKKEGTDTLWRNNMAYVIQCL